MNKAALGAIVALALAVAAGGGYWFGHSAADAGAAGPQRPARRGRQGRRTGGAAAAAGRDRRRSKSTALPQSITAVGSLRSDESVTLRPEVAGPHHRDPVPGRPARRQGRDAGQARRGDQRKPTSQQAHANLTLAKTKYDRAVDLRKQLHLGPGEGRGREQPEGRGGRARSSPRRGSRRRRSARRSPASSACARCRSATT